MRLFASHASADKTAVRRIVERLEDAGLQVWLDEARIRVGESIPEAIAKGLDSCDLLLLIFSRTSLRSSWVSRELNAFFMQAMRSEKLVIPCRLDDSDPPTLIADLKFADFGSSFEEGMAALLGAVGLADELAEMKKVEAVREALESEMSTEDREACYRVFIVRGHLKTSMDDWRYAPERETRSIDLLQRHGLVASSTDEESGEWTITPTARGMRVLSRWGPVQ